MKWGHWSAKLPSPLRAWTRLTPRWAPYLRPQSDPLQTLPCERQRGEQLCSLLLRPGGYLWARGLCSVHGPFHPGTCGHDPWSLCRELPGLAFSQSFSLSSKGFCYSIEWLCANLKKAPPLGGPFRKRSPFLRVCDLNPRQGTGFGVALAVLSFLCTNCTAICGTGREFRMSERERMKVERLGQASIWVEGQLIFAPQICKPCRQQRPSFNIRHWIIHKRFDWKAGLPTPINQMAKA